MAFEGYRERLHGHNYKVSVRLLGSRKVAQDGYVVDFGDIKKVTRRVCKQLNEHFLCPTLSNVLTIEEKGEKEECAVKLTCQDGSVFVFPRNDCAMLPIVHATAEELAVYLWSQILEGLNGDYLIRRGIHTMEVIVAEAVGQEAVFREEIPKDAKMTPLNVASFVMTGNLEPAPCPSLPRISDPLELVPTKLQSHGCNCCEQEFTRQLQKLASALNNQKCEMESIKGGNVTVEDLRKLLDTNQ